MARPQKTTDISETTSHPDVPGVVRASDMPAESTGPTVTLTLKPLDSSSVGYHSLKRLKKQDLCDLARPLLNTLGRLDVQYSPDSSAPMVSGMQELIKSRLPEKMKVPELLAVLWSFGADAGNILAVAEAVPALKTLYREAVNNMCLTYEQVKTLMGRLPVMRRTSDWYSSTIYAEPLLGFFSIETAGDSYYYWSDRKDWEKRTVFYLIPGTRRLLAQKLIGADALEPRLQAELAGTPGTTTADYAQSLGQSLAYLEGLDSSDSLLTPTGSMTAVRIPKLASKMPQAQPSDLWTDTGLDRNELLVAAYTAWTKHRKTEFDYPDAGSFVKFIIKDCAKYLESSLLSPFLPELKGFTAGWTSDNRAKEIVKAVDQLVLPADGEWMRTDNFKLRYMCSESFGSVREDFMCLFPPDAMRNHALKRKEENRDSTDPRSSSIDWWEEVTFRFVIGWLGMLCAAGIIEVACNANGRGKALEGIEAVRLTPLGRYAFGLTRKLDPAYTADRQAPAELDDTMTVAKLNGDNSPYAAFFGQIGTRIGGTRYRITLQTLMSGCNVPQEVQQRLKTFTSIVGKDMPPIWERLVAECRQRCNITLPVNAQYRLFRLDLSVPGLADFVRTDPTVRAYTMRAEQGCLLVETDYLSEVKNAFVKGGYMF